MKKIYLTIITLFCFSVAFSQNTNTYQVKKQNQTGAPTSIKFQAESGINHENFMSEMKGEFMFKEDDKLELIKITTDNYGFTHYKYSQTYKNIPVFGAEYIIHEKEGKATTANGSFYSNLSININPTKSTDEAITKAMVCLGLEKYRWQDAAAEKELKERTKNPDATYYPKPVLVIAPEKGNYKDGNFKLCWKFNIAGVSLSKSWTVFIDAKDGHIVNKISNVKNDGDATGSAATLYNGTQSITCNLYSGDYYLEEYETRGPSQSQLILTYNMNSDTLPNWGNASVYTNATTTFTTDEAANQVHWGVEQAYDFYYQNWQRNSFDNNGTKITNLVHYGQSLANAFWNGNDTVMVFGDGDGSTMGSVTGLDVAGHELTHSYNQHSAELPYQSESGALDESFADIFGTGVEFFALQNSANWTIGEDVMLADPFLRSLSDPKSASTPQPNTYEGEFWANTADLSENPGDYGGVHTNSGVQNYWFYLVSEGGSGTNDNGDVYSVTGIGIDAALNIAYRNISTQLTSSADYDAAVDGSIQAAEDIYGASSSEQQSVIDAWCAVGLGPCSSAGVEYLATVNTISVFPNPSSGIINVSSYSPSNNFSVKIVNVIGEEIYSTKMLSKTIQIDLNNVSSGIYFVQLNSDKSSVSKKVVIN